MTLPSGLSSLAPPAFVVLFIALFARLFDPQFAATPLISSEARGYYLLAFVILGLAMAVELVRRTVDDPELPVVAAGWTLIIGSATLLFPGHASPLAILGVAAIAVAEYWSREARASAVPAPAAELIDRIATAALFWLLLTGLLGFHLRWLLALPLAALAGSVAYTRLERVDRPRLISSLPAILVAGVASLQLVAATSFLDVRETTGAAIIVLSLAGVYAAGHLISNWISP